MNKISNNKSNAVAAYIPYSTSQNYKSKSGPKSNRSMQFKEGKDDILSEEELLQFWWLT